MITIEDKCIELVELMLKTKNNTKMYNKVFLPQYNEFRDYCLIFMEENEFRDMWNDCNIKVQTP